MMPGIRLSRLPVGSAYRCHWCRYERDDYDARFALFVDGIQLTDPLCSVHCAERDATEKRRGTLVFREAAQ